MNIQIRINDNSEWFHSIEDAKNYLDRHKEDENLKNEEDDEIGIDPEQEEKEIKILMKKYNLTYDTASFLHYTVIEQNNLKQGLRKNKTDLAGAEDFFLENGYIVDYETTTLIMFKKEK